MQNKAFSKIGILIILIILISGGYFSWQYWLQEEGVDKNTEWKTISHDDFKIKYPGNWEVLDEGIAPVVYISPKKDNRGIQIKVYTVYNLEDLQIKSLERVNIGGRDFYRNERINQNYKITEYIFIDDYNGGVSISLFIPNQERPDAHYISENEITSLLNIFHQVLSTLIF